MWTAAALSLAAQTFTSLYSFNGTDGSYPNGGLVQGADGDLYGTNADGGPNDGGTVFKITPSGALTTLYNFCSLGGSNCTDGAAPFAGLAQGTDGNFYGTTLLGGANNEGTVFKITPGGSLTTLYTFCLAGFPCLDGANPEAALVPGADGNFYGTSCGGPNNAGTVFKITPTGTLTTLHSFDYTDGALPSAPLVQGTDGNFYGTTGAYGGGSGCFGNGCGTAFKITPSGALTTLHVFEGPDGANSNNPPSGMVQVATGNFYGAMPVGGTKNSACNFGSCGTVFKLTPTGALTTLFRFDETDGANPAGGLVQATNGDFYGITFLGGANNDGTLFEITPGGMLTTLHTFDGTDGTESYGGLLQATDGKLYGASGGGANSLGTVFSLSVGLGPFVETLPISGRVGETVKVLGTNLTDATSVTFNGTPAAFTVVSHSLITTTVPAGATTGAVNVTTPNGTLKSNTPFHVRP